MLSNQYYNVSYTVMEKISVSTQTVKVRWIFVNQNYAKTFQNYTSFCSSIFIQIPYLVIYRPHIFPKFNSSNLRLRLIHGFRDLFLPCQIALFSLFYYLFTIQLLLQIIIQSEQIIKRSKIKILMEIIPDKHINLNLLKLNDKVRIDTFGSDFVRHLILQVIDVFYPYKNSSWFIMIRGTNITTDSKFDAAAMY